MFKRKLLYNFSIIVTQCQECDNVSDDKSITIKSNVNLNFEETFSLVLLDITPLDIQYFLFYQIKMEEPLSKIPINIAGSSRVTTPVKQRAVTPNNRNSEIRSTSVTNKLKLAQTILEVQLSQKYVSRRKQRKWENANMIYLNRIMGHLADESTDPQNSLGLATKHHFHWSGLSDMDRNLLDVYQQTSNKSKRVIRQDEWNTEETLWIAKVKKNLRGVIVEMLGKRDDLIEFLKNLEIILCCYIENHEVPDINDLPESFRDCLDTQLSFQIIDNNLNIFLKEMPLHRLIIFTACQFYGLHTNVTRQENDISAIQISFPKNMTSVASADCSLLGYLLVLLQRESVTDSISPRVDMSDTPP